MEYSAGALWYAGGSRFDLIASDGGKTARATTPSNTQIEGFWLHKTVYWYALSLYR